MVPPEDRPNPGPSDPVALMENAEPAILPALLRTTPAAVRHTESAIRPSGIGPSTWPDTSAVIVCDE